MPKEDPMSIQAFLARCLRWAAAPGMLAAVLVGIALPPAGAAASGGPPPGYARIWLYRYYEPYVTLATPYVRFNGQVVAISEPGGAFYRDVAPGEYRVTVDSDGRDVNQFANVGAVAGQQIYIEVQASRYWDCGGGGDRGNGWCRPTFYTRLQLPQVAAEAIAHIPLYNGS
jgi:hypothetical protein